MIHTLQRGRIKLVLEADSMAEYQGWLTVLTAKIIELQVKIILENVLH